MTINFEILWTHLLTATHPQILFCPNFQWKEPSSYQLSSYSTSLHGLCGYSFLFIFDHNIQVEFHGAHIAHLHPAPQPGKNQPLQSIDHCFESAKHHALQAEAEKSFEKFGKLLIRTIIREIPEIARKSQEIVREIREIRKLFRNADIAWLFEVAWSRQDKRFQKEIKIAHGSKFKKKRL